MAAGSAALALCARPAPVATERIETTEAHAAAGAAELTAQSDLVVRGVATGRRRSERVAGVPFVVTEVRVTSVVAGPAVDTVWVRQVGGPGVETPDAPVLVAGHAYLLYLQRFAYGPGDRPSGQYVVTGGGAGVVAA